MDGIDCLGLVFRGHVKEEVVEEWMSTLLSQKVLSELDGFHPQVGGIVTYTENRSILGMNPNVEFHPGCANVYKDLGYWKDNWKRATLD